MNRRALLKAAASLLLCGCGGPSPEQPIDAANSLSTSNGLLTLFFSSDIGVVARLDARDAAEEHWIELAYGVAGYVTAIQGVGVFPASPRRVFVHSRPYLTAPHAQMQQGYVDLDSVNRDVHVTLGRAAELPDLLHQLVHSHWYPYQVWDQEPTYVVGGQVVTLWSEVLARQKVLVDRLRFLRGVP